jgi:hypothetical protein
MRLWKQYLERIISVKMKNILCILQICFKPWRKVAVFWIRHKSQMDSLGNLTLKMIRQYLDGTRKSQNSKKVT